VTIGGDGSNLNFGFDIDAGSGSFARGIYLEGGNDGVQIIGNDIDAGSQGMAVETTGEGVSNALFLDNAFHGNSPQALVYINGDTSLGHASDNVDFVGNSFAGGANSGLLLGTEAGNSQITGNAFSGNASYAQLEVFEPGNTISGNDFEADGTVAISDSGSDYSEADLAAGNDYVPGWVRVDGVDKVFTSIQEAIDAAPANATITVGPGAFHEALTITTEGLSIVAAEPGETILLGTLTTTSAIPGNPSWDGSSPLNDYFEANHPGYSGSNGITVGADGVSISGLQFSGFVNAIQLGTSEGASVTGNHFVNNVRGINKDGAAEVTDVTISDNVFENGVHGITISAGRVGDTGVGSFDGVTMDGNSFKALSEKGMYFEQLSNAAISGSTFDDVGNYGRISPPFGGTDGAFGQALELNLKYQAYSDIAFTDTTITNSGHSNKDGAGSTGTGAAAVGIKVRDDGDDYGTLKASVTDTVKFDGLTIDGTSTGVRVGEPNKGNDGPDVELTDYKVSNATVGDIDNATDADPALGGTVEVTLAASEANLDADQSQANLVVNGNALENVVSTGSGDDRFEGFGGDDTFNGGAGIDTLVLNGDIDDYAVNLADGTVADEYDTDGDEGTDSFDDVEIIEFASGGRLLIVGAGGFETLADALAAAQANDTIMLSEGDPPHVGDVTIGAHLSGLRIVGAHRGDADTDGRNPSDGLGESSFDGRILILADNVEIDGIRVVDGIPAGSGKDYAGIQVQGANATIKNSVFYKAGPATLDTSRGIVASNAAIGLTVSASVFQGWHTGVYVNGGADTEIAGNLFNANLVGVSLDAYPGSTGLDVYGNTFDGQLFEGIGIGVDPGSPSATWTAGAHGISGNTFNGDTADGNGLGNYNANTALGLIHGNAFNGTAGNDDIIVDRWDGAGKSGSNTLDGGAGTGDTADYSFATEGLSVSFTSGDDTVTGATQVGTDTLKNIERVVTGSGNDSISYALGAGAVGIDANGGTDTLSINGASAAGAQSYAVVPGSLKVTITGNVAGEVIAEEVERLNLTLGNHGDSVTLSGNLGAGGAGLSNDRAHNSITGGTGGDVVDMSAMSSATGFTMNLGGGDDTVRLGKGSSTIDGGTGSHDRLDASHATNAVTIKLHQASNNAFGLDIGSHTVTNFEDLAGGAGNDVLEGNAADNVFYASNGADHIDGRGGNNTFNASGWTEHSTIDLNSTAGNAFATASLTNIQNAIGGSGDDFIYGTAVANRLEGGGGNDVLRGGGGNDTIVGGAGDRDVAVFSGNRQDYTVLVSKLAGVSTVTVTHKTSLETDTLTGVEYLTFDNGVNTVTVEVDDVTDFNMNTSADILGLNTTSGWLSYRDGSTPGQVGVGNYAGRTVLGIGDFNGDGKDDILSKTNSSGWTSYVNGADPNAKTDVMDFTGRTVLAIGDFNGDGRDDVLSKTNSSGWLSYLSGASAAAKIDVGDFAGRTVLAIGDFNGDGKDDILSKTDATGFASYLSGGDPNAKVVISDFTGRNTLAVGDINGDGKDDILQTTVATGWTSYLSGANPAVRVDVGSFAGRTFIAMGDFDGDGRADIVTRYDANGQLSYYSGGNVASQTFIGDFTNRTLLGIDDYNGDGRDDVLFMENSTQVVAYASAGNMSQLTVAGGYSAIHDVIADLGTGAGDDMLIA
jgi:hypothetical protein